jgi:hypothetical protein
MPWSPETRAAQAARIRARRPWLRSTGPRTVEGKRRSSRNADKGRWRPHLRAIAKLIRLVSLGLPTSETIEALLPASRPRLGSQSAMARRAGFPTHRVERWRQQSGQAPRLERQHAVGSRPPQDESRQRSAFVQTHTVRSVSSHEGWLPALARYGDLRLGVGFRRARSGV